jgi:hypothetical protein
MLPHEIVELAQFLANHGMSGRIGANQPPKPG